MMSIMSTRPMMLTPMAVSVSVTLLANIMTSAPTNSVIDVTSAPRLCPSVWPMASTSLVMRLSTSP